MHVCVHIYIYIYIYIERERGMHAYVYVQCASDTVAYCTTVNGIMHCDIIVYDVTIYVCALYCVL